MTWTIPVELVDRLASATGLSMIVKAKLAGAVFQGTAQVFLRAGHFVADCPFVEPIGPERQDGVTVMLGVLPEENAR